MTERKRTRYNNRAGIVAAFKSLKVGRLEVKYIWPHGWYGDKYVSVSKVGQATVQITAKAIKTHEELDRITDELQALGIKDLSLSLSGTGTITTTGTQNKALEEYEAKEEADRVRLREAAKKRKAAAAKQAREAKRKMEEQDAPNDLAVALSILKKHGLKVVTVQEKK